MIQSNDIASWVVNTPIQVPRFALRLGGKAARTPTPTVFIGQSPYSVDVKNYEQPPTHMDGHGKSLFEI